MAGVNMDSVAIKEELKKYTNLYPYIKKNYHDYYVMNKTGTDDNGGLSRAKVAWQRLAGKVMNLEGIVKQQIALNLDLVDDRSRGIKVWKRRWNKESGRLKTLHRNNVAGRPLQNQLYDEHTNNIVESIFYIIGILGIGVFISKQIKQETI
jgi:hypothetical protein